MKQLRTVSMLTAFLVSAVLLSSCVTVTARMKGPLASFTVRENRKGEVWGEFTSPYVPAAVVKGDVVQIPEGIRFYITGVKLFSSWPNGWTEGLLEGSGAIILSREKTGWAFHVEDELSLWDVVSGEIRYYDTYYRGDEGLRKVKNRVDRMIQVSRFLREEREFPPFYGAIMKETSHGRGFTPDVVSFLFPETEKRFKRKERKQIFTEENRLYESASREKVLGADMYWRVEYSEKILPEHLVPLRNSGTLWRDYEEAAPVFYSLYNLEYLFNNLLEGSIVAENN